MRDSIASVIDRLLVRLLLAGARRRWPLLRPVPSSWLRPVLEPRARRLRRPLGHGAFWLAVATAAIVVLVALVH